MLSNLSALNCFSGSFIFNTITHSMIRSLMARWLNLVYDALYRSKTIALSQIQIHVLWTHLKSLLAHYFLRSSFFSFLLSYFLTMLVSVFTSRTVSINEFVVFISSASGISQILVFCAALVSKKCFSYVSTYKLQWTRFAQSLSYLHYPLSQFFFTEYAYITGSHSKTIIPNLRANFAGQRSPPYNPKVLYASISR